MPKKNAKTKRPVVRRTSPTSCSAVLMGVEIARYIFSLGDIGDKQCKRMSFKIGTYYKDERDNGGLCEAAMASEIAVAIDRIRKTNPTVLRSPRLGGDKQGPVVGISGK